MITTILISFGTFVAGGAVGSLGSFLLAKETIDKYRTRFSGAVKTINLLQEGKPAQLPPPPPKKTPQRQKVKGPDYHDLTGEERYLIIKERYELGKEIQDDFDRWPIYDKYWRSEGEKLKLKQERKWEK